MPPDSDIEDPPEPATAEVGFELSYRRLMQNLVDNPRRRAGNSCSQQRTTHRSSPTEHPHLVHELAVLADQRHRAGQALSSDPLEEWHRHSLPEFRERMRTRLRNHCQEDHQSWPAKGRYSRHVGEASRRRRMDAYAGDVRALKSTDDQDRSPRLGPVDLETGEIKQP